MSLALPRYLMSPRSKILIVDDEPEVGEILGVLLEEQFDCEIFTDAARALEALRRTDFPLIITDLEMPQISGLRFIKEVRELNQKTAILISTGHDSSHPKVQEALRAGANGILTKPFMDPDDLIRSVQNLIH
jgi:DNA-binding response OmpR family regulator